MGMPPRIFNFLIIMLCTPVIVHFLISYSIVMVVDAVTSYVVATVYYTLTRGVETPVKQRKYKTKASGFHKRNCEKVRS